MSDALANNLYRLIAEANKPRVMEHFHASSIAECPRAHYFKRLGVEPLSVPGAGKMLRWQAGHIIEEVIRPHLLKLYPDLESNIRLTSEAMDLTGEYDNYSEAEETIFEIKSISVRAPKYKRKEDTRHHLREEKPYLNHEYQNHCYVKLLREIGKPVKHIVYVYITLDGLIITYKTDVQDDLLVAVDKRLTLLTSATPDNPPPCLCNDNHPLWFSTMQYCDYRDGNDCCNLKLLNKEKVNVN